MTHMTNSQSLPKLTVQEAGIRHALLPLLCVKSAESAFQSLEEGLLCLRARLEVDQGYQVAGLEDG